MAIWCSRKGKPEGYKGIHVVQRLSMEEKADQKEAHGDLRGHGGAPCHEAAEARLYNNFIKILRQKGGFYCM